MIRIIKELDVEVTKPNIFQAIVAKQYDMNSRFLKVTFMDCGTRIDIPLTATTKVIINAERIDGESKGFDGVINEDGTVTVPLHSWMLELEGIVICDISVIDIANNQEKKLTTTSFNLIVEKAAYGGKDITDDPQYDILVELLEKSEKEYVGKRTEQGGEIFNYYDEAENPNNEIFPFKNRAGKYAKAQNYSTSALAEMSTSMGNQTTALSKAGVSTGENTLAGYSGFKIHSYAFQSYGLKLFIDISGEAIEGKGYGYSVNNNGILMGEDAYYYGLNHYYDLFRIRNLGTSSKPTEPTYENGFGLICLEFKDESLWNNVWKTKNFDFSLDTTTTNWLFTDHTATNAYYVNNFNGNFTTGEDVRTLGKGAVGGGLHTRVKGDGALGQGIGLNVLGDGQTVVGKYNNPVANALFIVGNGTSDTNRANALEVHTDGTFKVAGNDITTETVTYQVSIGRGMDATATKTTLIQGDKKIVWLTVPVYAMHIEGSSTNYMGVFTMRSSIPNDFFNYEDVIELLGVNATNFEFAATNNGKMANIQPVIYDGSLYIMGSIINLDPNDAVENLPIPNSEPLYITMCLLV